MKALRAAYGMTRSLVMYYGPLWRGRRLPRFYSQFVKPGALCFDLGAHVGNRVRAFRSLGARVVAIEPQPACARLLELLYGSDPGVHLVRAAVGATRGTATLHVSRATPTVSTVSSSWMREVQADQRFASIRWDHTESVAMVTLDDLIDRWGVPDFCKIDVEGAELEVLQGLSHPLPALSFEFIPISRARTFACIDRLARMDRYRFRWSRVETMRWACPTWHDAAGIRALLEAEPLDGRSGDVYAVREPAVSPRPRALDIASGAKPARVTVSYAQSIDGTIAQPGGKPLRLSGAESMRLVHELRRSHDAILVGVNTVINDDPRLTVRLVNGADPQPVILDSRLRMPLDARLLRGSRRPWIYCGDGRDRRCEAALVEAGATVVVTPAGADGLLSVDWILDDLRRRGVESLLVEGGATVISKFIESGRVDEVVVTVSPQFVNGLQATNGRLTGSVPLQDVVVEHVGADIVLRGRPLRRDGSDGAG